MHLTKIIIEASLILNTNFCFGCWTCNVEDIPQSSLLAHRNNLPCSDLDQYTPVACDNIPRCKQAEYDICWVDRGMSTDFNAECQLGYECVILDPDTPSLVEIVKNTIVLPKISKQTGRCMKSTLFFTDSHHKNVRVAYSQSGSGSASGESSDYDGTTDTIVMMEGTTEVVYDLDRIDSDLFDNDISSGISIPDEFDDYEYEDEEELEEKPFFSRYQRFCDSNSKDYMGLKFCALDRTEFCEEKSPLITNACKTIHCVHGIWTISDKESCIEEWANEGKSVVSVIASVFQG